jgi:predicted nucleotidyltransferase
MDNPKALDRLVEKLKKAFEERLVSVLLYGSAAAGEHHERYSDLNVFCVLSQVTPRELEASEPVFRWWRELGNPAPLLMTAEEVRGSTDCFPIEFHDMLDRRRLLHGTDVVAPLVIDDRYYRAHVEHQLRAKLLRLRQKGAGVLHDRELLARLMADSVSTFLMLARHVLRLLGADPGITGRDVLLQLEAKLAIEAEPFSRLLEVREGMRKPASVEGRALFAQYLAAVEKLVAAVDRLET